MIRRASKEDFLEIYNMDFKYMKSFEPEDLVRWLDAKEHILKGYQENLDAFKYGVPPHGGIAYGLDRVVMELLHIDNIRDVIAFPKTQQATCLLTDAPAPAEDAQLEELFLNLVTPVKDEE